jgi:Ca2+-binding RTX toxin-like protein
LLGGDGNDVLDGRGGADLFRGGGGTDTADYTLRRNPVTVGIGTSADDGEKGEGDNVFTDVENIWGGRGNDVLRGSSASNRLAGGGGDDVLYGRGGRDTLLGGSGDDQLFARDGDRIGDTLDGGDGTDRASRDRIDILVSVEQLT